MRVAGLILLCTWFCGVSVAQVTLLRDEGPPLSDRVRTAASHSGTRLWVGYAFRRLMEPNTFVSSGWIRTGSASRSQTLDHVLVLAGDSSALPFQSAARLWQSDERVEKRVAILIQLDAGVPIHLKYQTTDAAYDSSNQPLVWLGDADSKESLLGLLQWFDRTPERPVKERLVRVIGLHQSGSNTESEFLRRILAGTDDPAIRRQAASSLAEFSSPEVLASLARSARQDNSSTVARAAIWALGEQHLAAASDTLIALLRQSTRTSLRKEIIQAIARRAEDKALPALRNVIENDQDADVRRLAVWSLANLQDGSGVPSLIELARSGSNPAIRKAAIQALAQTRDERAVEALIAIVREP